VKGPLVVVGDALLDRDLEGTVERLSPDAPVPVVDAPVSRARPGGAGLAALLAARDGWEVVLVTALADDEPGRELRRLLGDAGVVVLDLGLAGSTPEKVRVRAAGRSLLRLDHGGPAGPVGPLSEEAARALRSAAGVLVADYGRGMSAEASVRAALAGRGRAPVVWDPHPRGAAPSAGVALATPNAAEAAAFAPDAADGDEVAAVTARARALVARWEAGAVAVTLGRRGALLSGAAGAPLLVPAPPVPLADPCGAGDRFASAAAAALADGAVPSEAVEVAVARASAFVAAGGAAGLATAVPPADARPADATALVERVRAEGGTVVATGGCFDLLHAGHVAMLQAARRLGDCLVVCLNGDDSVRRLKGPDRPLQPASDRAAVLLALDCVDAVVVFDEDTPVEALERLRPSVFAKGADYAGADLPEARALARWGGQVVAVPYLQGRSTTRLVEEAVRRGR
jgi:D-beta-D-heptose 7-phosphate kinase / D-beta-D-heptose 1-phosphate adenosyltransferase